MSTEANFRAGTVSSSIQWKIPNFFTVMKDCGDKHKPVISPKITFSSVVWGLALSSRGKLYVILHTQDTRIDPRKPVTCFIGSQRTTLCSGNLTAELQAAYAGFNYWAFTCDRDELNRRKHELVPLNILTITFYFDEDPIDPPKVALQRIVELEHLAAGLETLFANKINTDVTIKVQEREFSAHKSVLMARSPVFLNMFEHDSHEKLTGVVTITDCDPDSFFILLQYLYTGKTDGILWGNVQQLYITSNKYGVQSLQKFCVAYMKENLHVKNVLDVAVFADRHEDSELELCSQEFFNRCFDEIIFTPRWRALLHELPMFANTLLQRMVKKDKGYAKKRRIAIEDDEEDGENSRG